MGAMIGFRDPGFGVYIGGYLKDSREDYIGLYEGDIRV